MFQNCEVSFDDLPHYFDLAVNEQLETDGDYNKYMQQRYTTQ